MKTQEEQLVFDFQDGKGPVPAHRHSNGGGWVSDTALVDASAFVSGEAKVFDKARVSGEAKVFDKARVFGEARVSGEARVFGEARVSGLARVSGGAWVFGEAKATKPCIVIVGLQYLVTITDEHLSAGCECHTFAEWRGFTPQRIAEMDGRDALMFYPQLLKILDAFVE